VTQLDSFSPDLILLDLGLPDIDGVELAAQLRSRTTAPIIVLSVRDSEHDKVSALDNGANDYLTKPFGMGELMARIRVALRPVAQLPQTPSAARRFTVGEITLDADRHEVVVRGAPVHLSPTEFNLLEVLMLNAGKLLTHRTLLHKVWGPEYAADTQLLRVYVAQLRTKIEERPDRPQYIVTEPGIGYRFRESA
jgi:two-component system KDP operon response regulator KdpE